jgi:ubiquinone biosynthesis monooxygenase Coq7
MANAPVAGRGRRPPLAGRPKAGAGEIEAMIRVDHAGEYGALRIYEGQMAVLSETAPYSEKLLAIRRMAAQEQRHFDELDRMVRARAVRPTALEPVWRVAGYALGAATALLGEKAAMACTVAVEDVIDQHYRRQLDRLGATDPELQDAIGRFHADECAHRDEAIAEGAREAPLYGAMTAAIRAGCRLAIALSERL